eukprot:TRINITY_DN33723_c0_g1_i1.p1 TRINITY_DN33723_c0_g1~~TRINITY_DN33723_c0_g1_i1.p1  ORF type:complete len:439 (-),score=78.60 TRINITY_DN33723_c0_g1_i1:162-1478(-)
MDWLSSLPAEEPEANCGEEQSVPVGTDTVQDNGHGEAASDDNSDDAQDTVESLVSMGFSKEAVEKALELSSGDYDEALKALQVQSRERQAKRRKTLGVSAEEEKQGDAFGEALEIDGISCTVASSGNLHLRLPHDPSTLGPVVGKKGKAGDIVFEGMDEWLWELYDSHKPRACALPTSFDIAAAVAALEAGAPYVWDNFATADEIKSAHQDLEELFSSGRMKRGSSSWNDECAEGGHARNRRSLEGQKRDDACGFWNLQGEEPAPPPGVYTFFRRLEAAAEQLRSKYGWPLVCSRSGMGAVYDGKGAQYKQHRDNEWQRHLKPRASGAPISGTGDGSSKGQSGAWMCYRELTMLAYVNPPENFDESPEGVRAGGRLRCYNATKRGDLSGATAAALQDLAPQGGRAVIFRSRELLHEVLPTFARRYCLTLWFQTCCDAG